MADIEYWLDVDTADPGNEVETEAEIPVSVLGNLAVDTPMAEDEKEKDGADDIPLMISCHLRQQYSTR